MLLRDLLLSTTDRAIYLQADDGSMPAGFNGPWQTPETPLRNTGSWLLAFVKAWQLTEDSKYRRAADAAADYLLHPCHRPGGITFHHRHVDYRDRGNGLIGQAWTLEALTTGGTALDRADMLWLAERCFLAQEQEEGSGLWKMRDIDESDLGPCQTLNQQLWFAAVGAMLADATNNSAITERVKRGLSGIAAHTANYSDGVFQHRVCRPVAELWKNPASTARDWGRRHLLPGKKRHRARELAVGYHSFCLYAIAVIARTLPANPLPDSSVVQRALEALNKQEYREALQGNKFAWSYNPTGIENAFALAVLKRSGASDHAWWLEEQWSRTFNPESGHLDRSAVDPTTSAARVYEISRLLDLASAGEPATRRETASPASR